MDITRRLGRLPQPRLNFDDVVGTFTGRPLDILYSRLGYLGGSFFSEGWGDLQVIDYEESMKLMSQWPPSNGLQVNWKLLSEGTHNGTKFKQYEGVFRTPCMKRVYDALPEASRTGRVQLMVPSGANEISGVVHLSGTGDESFARRLQIGLPLVCKGVASMALESPYYGARRPDTMRTSKLLRVSDLLVLGWATIFESMHLLHWMRNEGYVATGISGLSMGGVHACLTAALYPQEVAVVPCLTPRSAAVAYCHGAMRDGVQWHSLHQDLSTKHEEMQRAMLRASLPVSRMRGARYHNYQHHAPHPLHPLPDSLSQQQYEEPGDQHQHDAACATLQPGAEAAAHHGWNLPHGPETCSSTLERADSMHLAGLGASGAGAGALPVAVADAAAADERLRVAGAAEVLASSSSALGSMMMLEAALRRPQLSTQQHKQLLDTLTAVLETYTDIMRYPRPVRPDATVIVAASHDAYVCMDSVIEVHKYWEGSQLWRVPGGHVSGYLMHAETFRRALLEALQRVRQPAATTTAMSGLEEAHLTGMPVSSSSVGSAA